MDGAERSAQEFFGFEQVVDVGARVILGNIATKFRIYRGKVPLEPGGREIHAAIQRVGAAASPQSGGGHAVKCVRPRLNGAEKVIRLRDAQQVPGFGGGQFIAHPADDGAEVFFLQGAADAETAEAASAFCLSLVREFDESARCFSTQVFILCTLNHTPQRLEGFTCAFVGEAIVFVQAAFGPPVGAFHGGFLVFASVGQHGQFVESKHDVSAKLVLDLHGNFRGEAVPGAVDDAAEVHAVFVHKSVAVFLIGADHGFLGNVVHHEDFLVAHAEAHDLEAAGVSVGGFVPVLEGSHATGGVDDVGAGLEIQVISIGEDGLGPSLVDLFRGESFHGGFGAHRNESRGVDVPVRGVDDAGAAVVGAFEFHAYAKTYIYHGQ